MKMLSLEGKIEIVKAWEHRDIVTVTSDRESSANRHIISLNKTAVVSKSRYVQVKLGLFCVCLTTSHFLKDVRKFPDIKIYLVLIIVLLLQKKDPSCTKPQLSFIHFTVLCNCESDVISNISDCPVLII